MTNKTLGTGLIISLCIGVLTAIFEPALHYEVSDAFFGLSGLGMLFFGIWGSTRLIK